ncbi:meiotically up-regulated 190 protein [Pholiota molesta]|nr:meiotically up-regulated 190 protein [Pholiota molesta]
MYTPAPLCPSHIHYIPSFMPEFDYSSLEDESSKANEREVTDPITHLPLTIHDTDAVELERIPPPPTATQEKKLDAQRGSNSKEDTNARHVDMESVVRQVLDANWWEDPIGDQRRARIQISLVAAGAATVGAFSMVVLWSSFGSAFGGQGSGVSLWSFISMLVLCCILGLSSPHTLNKDEKAPESAQWLNAFLKSIWSIVNPSVFVPIADMLEDTMQATLPRMVRGVRVADISQGSESMRVLGIRWLDKGSAAKDVNGMKAEEGDFVNMEFAIAYRAKETTGMRARSENAHLLMEFWVASGLMIPVWVELTGLLATLRVRLQLIPNPPFLSMMTLTVLGLPKVTLKCTPLAKNFLNVMDVPGLSHWLQKSINLAVEKYVAPRSMNLDLRTLLMGRPKLDTQAAGVVIVTVRRIEGCRGDSIKLLSASDNGKACDLYVTVGWSKWGKPLWSTRIISDIDPVWEETTALLVGPSEINGHEGIRLQVWDSDRFTVDDLMGNVEISLQDLMTNDISLNRMTTRTDKLVGERGKPLPGTLHWECGYFAKTTLEQHVQHKRRDADETRTKVEKEAEEKLREANAKGTRQKEDMKEKTDEIVATTEPTSEWPSGILSIWIEQISGLEIDKGKDSDVREDAEDQEDGNLPSAYCTIILNEQRVYKTRTKMKSNNPFFAAGTEKFIRDWQTTDVIISVRDYRLHEVDPVIGVVILPLRDLFKTRSELTDSFPLVGGIGYGRMRLSLVFRSVQLRLPKRLLGWDVGTLEVSPQIKPSSNLPREYESCRILLRTPYGRRMDLKGGNPIRLAIKKRYASCLLLQLRKSVVGPDPTPAFATLWLKEIPDNETLNLSLPVFRNTNRAFDHAQKNATTGFGEQVGTLDLTVRFWPALSGYHRYMADHDKNMADVMEVLDFAESNPSEDSSSSEDEETGDKPSGPNDPARKVGVLGQLKNFRKHQGELHRRHRGLMQWKAVRNVAWIGRSVEHQAEKLSDSVMSTFKHKPYEAGVEKEV